jgi:hypothetical protein
VLISGRTNKTNRANDPSFTITTTSPVAQNKFINQRCAAAWHMQALLLRMILFCGQSKLIPSVTTPAAAAAAAVTMSVLPLLLLLLLLLRLVPGAPSAAP